MVITQHRIAWCPHIFFVLTFSRGQYMWCSIELGVRPAPWEAPATVPLREVKSRPERPAGTPRGRPGRGRYSPGRVALPAVEADQSRPLRKQRGGSIPPCLPLSLELDDAAEKSARAAGWRCAGPDPAHACQRGVAGAGRRMAGTAAGHPEPQRRGAGAGGDGRPGGTDGPAEKIDSLWQPARRTG